ncbi:hypothetical protein F2Q65_12505 [Thiohalocapsa marina]|uniref:Peptidase C1A papain C-terminal domain-containing protein n=1 Tax=Thiohalocapsa marina TaxID=424902 RepID=A0A5M8FHM7_9GAMM|nr:lectin like domain-containing protein [Thiohalocapsa marina]KAA6184393.1 hypothetical protein F2Q65_12505 [Thiohalocapsa marina]
MKPTCLKNSLVPRLFVIACLCLPTMALSEEPIERLRSLGLSVSPSSAAFERFLERRAAGKWITKTDDGRALGSTPAPFRMPPRRDLAGVRASAKFEQPLPAYYDLRTTRPKGVTPVVSQGSCGACWTFAAMAAIESNTRYTRGVITDLSEADLNERHGFDNPVCSGGNPTMATAYIARGSGPLTESDAPYPSWYFSSTPTGPIDPNPDAAASTADLGWRRPINRPATEDRVFYPMDVHMLEKAGAALNPEEMWWIKNALYRNGAVLMAFMWADQYYNPRTYAYYNGIDTYANHEVTIVGWDDHYPASNFIDPPGANGAFIVKNSWGTDWGDAGYFYISYEDVTIDRITQFQDAVPSRPYTHIYQYDPLGVVDVGGFDTDTAWFANVFIASAKGAAINGAGFYTVGPSSYTVQIYSGTEIVDNFPYINPTAGTLEHEQLGELSEAGYHTIHFDWPARVTPGQPFSVVVRLTTPGETKIVGLEFAKKGYSSAASSVHGQSYMSPDGNAWFSLGEDANVTLKAFATATSPGPFWLGKGGGVRRSSGSDKDSFISRAPWALESGRL